MQIVEKKITELKAYEKNPRKNDNAVGPVAESIKEFGFKVPIIIDKDNVIVAGHTRLRAAKKLGIKTVPCIIADDLTPDQIKAFRLADNKVSEFAEWDIELLTSELKDINIEMDVFGFENELNIEDVKEDEFDAELPEEPKAKLGDIYKLGNHRLMCGDSTDRATVEKLMNGVKADMVFTDPPYGIDIVNNGKVGADNLAKCGEYSPVIGDETTNTAEAMYNTCVSLGYKRFIIWGGNYFISFLPFSASWIVWDKRGDVSSNNFADGEMAWCSFETPIRIYKQLWMGMIREGEHDKRVHPTQKPVKLLGDILTDFTKDNDIILDLFGGSGSTLIACEQLNRTCYMMELDPKYVQVIIQRYIAFKGTSDDVYRINADGTKTKYEDIT